MSASECESLLIRLSFGNLARSIWCHHKTMAVAAAVLRWYKHQQPQHVLHFWKWCTADVRCYHCLSHFESFACVSISKFSLCQSASSVTLSQLKNTSFYLKSHANPALRHNKDFNIATAQWLHQTVHANFRMNMACNRGSRICSRILPPLIVLIICRWLSPSPLSLSLSLSYCQCHNHIQHAQTHTYTYTSFYAGLMRKIGQRRKAGLKRL